MSLEWDFTQTLHRLKDSTRPLSMAGLQALSALSAQDLILLRQAWPDIALEQRRKIVASLVELAEDNVELDFNDVFKFCLEDSDAEVRLHAVEGLWEDNAFDTADLLLAVLGKDASPMVRAAAASCLGHFVYLAEMERLDPPTSAKVKESLLRIISDQKEPVGVRRRAVESISYLSENQIKEIIERAYADPDPKMHISAVSGMGRNCDPRWLETIFKELDNADPEMRYEAAQACGEMEDRRAIPRLNETIKEDEDLQVRLAAISALGKIGGQLAKEILERWANGPDEHLRAAAQETLEQIEVLEDPLHFHLN
ncbi:MAG: HEAT repeat domain-containing protein [Chloroflexi bacterium]|nr:HEAT repeat domain-containing protein [Chloroflexota bacterium]MCL5074929.1 HEAT repeat domain-containing protein [Chloroflexota bacterium]